MKTFWTMDDHVFASHDLETTMEKSGHKVYNRCFRHYRNIHRTSDASSNKELRYLDRYQIPERYDYNTFERLSHTLKKEVDGLGIDYFYCGYSPTLIHLYTKVDAPTILNLSFRLEGNITPTPKNFDRFIEIVMQEIDNKKLNVYAHADYDIAYFKYFTGLDIKRLPAKMTYLDHLSWEDAHANDKVLIYDKRGPLQHYSVNYGYHYALENLGVASDVYSQKFMKSLTPPLFPIGSWRHFLQKKISHYSVHAPAFDIKKTTIKSFINPRSYLNANRRQSLLMDHRKFYKRGFYEYGQGMKHRLEDILKYKALVVFPYSVFSGEHLEFFKMGVPMFFPSKKLMSKWHKRFLAINEKTSSYPNPPNHRCAGKFSNIAYGKDLMPDPNDGFDAESIDYWTEKCEWYRRPLLYFDSPQDLAEKIKTTDFIQVSNRMKAYQKKLDAENDSIWSQYLK